MNKCTPSNIVLLSYPPQNQCKDCGQTWFTHQEAPTCKVQGDFQTPLQTKMDEEILTTEVKKWFKLMNKKAIKESNESLLNRIVEKIKNMPKSPEDTANDVEREILSILKEEMK